MEEQPPPLILCMEDTSGEEVNLSIEPNDDFQTFLDKAKSLLGFDVDINSITANQTVSLSENIYQYFLKSEHILQNGGEISPQNFKQTEETSKNGNDDLVYVLEDGTQIRASQIHFDNDDPPVDLTAENIPFVKYADDSADEQETDKSLESTKNINIVESPVSRWSSQTSSPRCSFVSSLPFKLVCSNASNFETQFNKYLEVSATKTYATLNPVLNSNTSPKSLIRDNYKNYDENYEAKNNNDDFRNFTREEILNMFKDSPVPSLPYEDNQNYNEKRRHIRKTDPTRLVHKRCNTKPTSYLDLNTVRKSQNCFVCGKIDKTLEKMYLFDTEDQKLYRGLSPKKYPNQLKIICEECLAKNFKPCCMKSPTQTLKSDEYLVIKNNQQYIFQKTCDFKMYNFLEDVKESNLEIDKQYSKNEKHEFVKVEIGSDGEIVTKPVDTDTRFSDDVIIIKDERKDNSSDVEIIEPKMDIDDNIIDNLEEADEEVKEFLGIYQCDGGEKFKELKCRFCDKIFEQISQVIEHGEEHKHNLDDGEVFPCPLCDYGYANFKWLKGHLKAVHDREKTAKDIASSKVEGKEDEKPATPYSSPVAKRTRSAAKSIESDDDKEHQQDNSNKLTTKLESNDVTLTIKTEVKQECLDSSDEEAIWIVQTGDQEATETLHHIFKGSDIDPEGKAKKNFKCNTCSQIFPSAEILKVHKCRRRGRKRRGLSKKETAVYIPSEEDFIRRAQGRLRPVKVSNENDLLVVRTRRKRSREPTSDPQVVTCNDCNESFTSKVRLKFHMQFHDTSTQLMRDGQYWCHECEDVSFPTESELFDHVHFQHDKQKRWQCPVKDCGKTFYLRATLTKHSRTHTDTRRYVCVTCQKRFLDKQTLDEHGVTHLQTKPFKCHICFKQLTRRSRLRMHLRAHEEELAPRLVLVCAACGRAFRDAQDAQEHASKSAECMEQYSPQVKEENGSVQLSPTSGLVRHTNAVSGLVSPHADYGSEGAALLATLPDIARPLIRVVEIEKAFRCEFCEDVFYLEDALNTHRVIHKGVKNPFTCHICKVSFATYSRCTTHKTTHGFYKRSLADAKKQLVKSPSRSEAGPSATGILGYGGFPVVKHFLCEDCGRSYLHWTYLQVHRRMKHANENFLYKCNQCDLTFPNSWGVAYHRKKIHGKTGPEEQGGATKIARDDYRIPCRDCDEILPNKNALYAHRQKNHSDMSLQMGGSQGESGHGAPEMLEQPHTSRLPSCSKCGHNFTEPAALQRHLKEVHGHEADARSRVHACAVCGRVFRSACVRNEHLRVHTGERPFPCDVCGVAFRRSTAMRNHRLIHSGVRPWACTRCPKRFRIRSDLRTHFRLKHPMQLVVIGIKGLNPTTEEVIRCLNENNISQDGVIEITKMSFEKGTSSIIPNSTRALSLLHAVPRTRIACEPPLPRHSDIFQPVRRGRGIAKNPRKSKTQGTDEENNQETSPHTVTLDPNNEELSNINMQLILPDGALVNGNQMVQLHLDDNMHTE